MQNIVFLFADIQNDLSLFAKLANISSELSLIQTLLNNSIQGTFPSRNIATKIPLIKFKWISVISCDYLNLLLQQKCKQKITVLVMRQFAAGFEDHGAGT